MNIDYQVSLLVRRLLQSFPKQEKKQYERVYSKIAEDILGPFAFPLNKEVVVPKIIPSVQSKAIANTIYNERRFEDLPILCDSLEDDGIDTDHIVIRHLKSIGPHYKGMWSLDLIK